MDNPSFPQPQITCWAPRACGLRAPPGNAPRCRAATGPPRRSRGRSVDFHYFNPRVPILWTDGGDRATAAPREGSDAHGFLIPPARTEREREREGPAREQMQRTPSSHYSFRICSTPTPSPMPVSITGCITSSSPTPSTTTSSGGGAITSASAGGGGPGDAAGRRYWSAALRQRRPFLSS